MAVAAAVAVAAVADVAAVAVVAMSMTNMPLAHYLTLETFPGTWPATVGPAGRPQNIEKPRVFIRFLYDGNATATRRRPPRERQLGPSRRPTQQEPFARALGNHFLKDGVRPQE